MNLKLRRYLIILALIITAALVAQLPVGGGRESVVLAHDDLLRLHFIAHSDTARDQALKREVRDCLLEMVAEELEKDAGPDETRAYFEANRSRLEEVAELVLKANGSGHSVDVSIGSHWFPEKTSGSVIVPAGWYESVRVVIGEGRGHNWWCVLFPQLCLADGELSPAEAQAVIANAGLAPGESFVDEDSLDDVSFEVRVRVAEWARSFLVHHPRWRTWLSWLE